MTQKPIDRTTPKPRIAACPKCKTDANIAVYTYDSGWCHVECDKCYYLGPGDGSVRAAIKAHNTALLFSRGLKIPVYGEAAWKADTLRGVRTHGQ